MKQYGIAIHGGAGTILKSSMTPDQQAAYEAGLQDALTVGNGILSKGGSALDAVAVAVACLEDCPLFNAGKGSVFNHNGAHEMDAAIMYGADLSAGAVCVIQKVKNPVLVARAVMEHSGHVMLSGEGALAFAQAQQMPTADDDYFYVAHRYNQWQEALKEDRIQLDHSDKKYSTVGAVAKDVHGHLAAATSTGGLTNKKFGRIGDSPIIGAGTYANDATCAISCTGVGELFIRSVVAHDISCLMEYKGLSLQAACDVLVHDKLLKIGGEGGLIAIDAHGNIALPFNSEGMYRGHWLEGEAPSISIYK